MEDEKGKLKWYGMVPNAGPAKFMAAYFEFVENKVADRMAAKSRTQRSLTATFSETSADVRGSVDGEKSPSGVERVGLPEDGAIPYDPGGGINIC
ncbi:hypothetical protein V6N13_047526 [Hibiscus sabdariffa]|uniref:Uncharacterized protein n=1 Tax=Hibiscus sabdariffa TaxID=183260 RepID=A0ABR2F4F3_9ROSI